MATRFYLSDVGDEPVAPSYDSNWEVVTDANRKPLIRKLLLETADALNYRTVDIPDAVSQDILSYQFISEPLRAQVIAGTVSLVIKCSENLITANASLAVVVNLFSQDGQTLRGTLFSVFSTDSEFGTTASTRIVNTQNLTQLTAQEQDRIVVEIGATVSTPVLSTFVLYRGNNAASDFALTSGLTTDLNPWIEFSQDLFSPMPNNYQFVSAGDGTSVTEKIR